LTEATDGPLSNNEGCPQCRKAVGAALALEAILEAAGKAPGTLQDLLSKYRQTDASSFSEAVFNEFVDRRKKAESLADDLRRLLDGEALVKAGSYVPFGISDPVIYKIHQTAFEEPGGAVAKLLADITQEDLKNLMRAYYRVCRISLDLHHGVEILYRWAIETKDPTAELMVEVGSILRSTPGEVTYFERADVFVRGLARLRCPDGETCKRNEADDTTSLCTVHLARALERGTVTPGEKKRLLLLESKIRSVTPNQTTV